MESRDVRYLGRPSWWDEDDCRPAGRPECIVELGTTEALYTMVIRCPFGVGTDTLLTVYANRETLEVTAAEAPATAVLDARRREPAA